MRSAKTAYWHRHRCLRHLPAPYAILIRGGTAVIQVRRNGRLWKDNCPTTRARTYILCATSPSIGPTGRFRSGYHARSRTEAKLRCLKPFGERITSRNANFQSAEFHIRIVLMNNFDTLGTASPRSSAWHMINGVRGDRAQPRFCNNAIMANRLTSRGGSMCKGLDLHQAFSLQTPSWLASRRRQEPVHSKKRKAEESCQ